MLSVKLLHLLKGSSRTAGNTDTMLGIFVCMMIVVSLSCEPSLAGEAQNKKLLEATARGDLAVVEHVLDNGADIDVRNDAGYTALQVAVIKGHKDITALLVLRGAKIDAEPKGESYSRYLFNTPLRKQGTALHMACASGRMDLAEILINAGANVNAKVSSLGSTPLHMAIWGTWKQTDQDVVGQLVRFLINKGACVNASDNIGERPLDYACRFEMEDIITLLLSQGASVVTYKDGQPSFQIVTVIHCPQVTRALLKEDTATLSLLPTVLHLASYYGKVSVIELLLSHGVDVNARDKIGFRNLKNELDANRDPYLVALSNSTGDSRSNDPKLLFGLLGMYRLEIQRRLRATRALCYFAQNFHTAGGTALHWASAGNRADVAELLLSKGVDIHASDEEGHTALHVASAVHSPEVVRILLAHGADVNARDNNDMTALAWAKRSESSVSSRYNRYQDYCDYDKTDYPRVIELLKAHGAEE
ncbi:ankyrin repeat domain-containing protein [Desulfomonile tiedjei]|uniref:Ankyrin repeat-containing protein n=1 Tax=Desulfomonile tiedjei (strain ATCC 49306 / DSM 6799 / DCB-1) TaxID=706587 RepID=I4CDY0_DESTA|nr:ankyrin repeat domain-containing protein [Desulfomonile tiedjei]AFM27771.1 ankyrin repeat-containing protein [Desulfomonile tiedjei DSM 6799]